MNGVSLGGDKFSMHLPELGRSLARSITARPAKSSFAAWRKLRGGWGSAISVHKSKFLKQLTAPSSSNTPTNSFWYAWKMGKIQARRDLLGQTGLMKPSITSVAKANGPQTK